MKKEFFDAVRRGEKTTTLRFWRWQRVRAGQVHTVPHLGKLRIDTVRQVALAELTGEDAAADGFASLAELQSALEQMYPGAALAGADDDGRKLYLVHFTFLGDGAA